MKKFDTHAIDILLRAVDDLGSQTALARLGNVAKGTLNRWLSGERNPLEEIGRVFDALGVTLLEPGVKANDFALIPKVEAKAGAGSSLLTSDQVEGLYAFRRSFLESIKVSQSRIIMMDVWGSSMSPLIQDGDTILVDTADNLLKDGGIFVVGFEDELLVKRLQKLPNGWKLVSENRGFGDVEVVGQDLEKFRVYGKVRWFGRVLKE